MLRYIIVETKPLSKPHLDLMFGEISILIIYKSYEISCKKPKNSKKISQKKLFFFFFAIVLLVFLR